MTTIDRGSFILQQLATRQRMEALGLKADEAGNIDASRSSVVSASGARGQAAIDEVAFGRSVVNLESLATLGRYGGWFGAKEATIDEKSTRAIDHMNLSLGGLSDHLAVAARKLEGGLTKESVFRLEGRVREALEGLRKIQSGETDLSQVDPTAIRGTLKALHTLTKSVSTFGVAFSIERERFAAELHANRDQSVIRSLVATSSLLESLGTAASALAAYRHLPQDLEHEVARLTAMAKSDAPAPMYRDPVMGLTGELAQQPRHGLTPTGPQRAR